MYEYIAGEAFLTSLIVNLYQVWEKEPTNTLEKVWTPFG